MTDIGCLLWLWLLAATLGVGYAVAIRGQAGFVIGIGWGVSAWFTAMAAYLCVLSILDAHRARTRPLIGVPRGTVPAIWACCAAGVAATIWLSRRLFVGGE